MMMKIMKNILKPIFAIISFIASIGVGIWAITIPPEGIIDSSVLWFIAQLLLFTSSIIGIDYHVYSSKDNKKSE